MNSALIPEPTQAGLAATAAPGPLRPGITAPGGVVASTGAATPGQPGAFSALLLGLRPGAAATTAPLPALPTTADGDLAVPEALPVVQFNAVAAASSAAPEPGPAADADPANGESLPESGSGLPLPDLDALLASLSSPVSGAATPPSRSGTGNIPEAGNSPDAIALPGSAPGEGQRAGLPDTVARALAAANDAGADPSARTQAAAVEPDAEARSADPLATRSEAAIDPSSVRASPGATEPAPPADARARLDALLAPAQRLAAGTEAAAMPLTATAPSAASTQAATTAAPAAAPALFESLPMLEPLADRNAWTQGLGERLLLMAERGTQSATLRLQPEHLGPMEIRIHVDEDGAAEVRFSAHQAPTREALENAIPRLRELLAEQGLNLTQANVDAGRNGFAQRGFALPLPPRPDWPGDEAETATQLATTAWQIRPDSTRRVDVFV